MSSRRGVVLVLPATIAIVFAGACTPPGPTPPTTTTTTTTTPTDPTRIGPHEQFNGLVNGTAKDPVVYTACGGPVTLNRTGPVVGGQTVAVHRDPNGDGLTDRNGVVFARTNGSGYVVAISNYDTPVAFPDGIQVPCDGPGTIIFDPCYGIIGCTQGGHAAVVKVTFVNIAD